MLWNWISIDPRFNNIGGFKVCLNFVPIDTILIIHVIDDITQSISMTLFDGMARVLVKWTDFKILEGDQGSGLSLGREMAFRARRMENRVGMDRG